MFSVDDNFWKVGGGCVQVSQFPRVSYWTEKPADARSPISSMKVSLDCFLGQALVKPSGSEFESDWHAQTPLCDIILTKNFTQSHHGLFLSLSGQGAIQTTFSCLFSQCSDLSQHKSRQTLLHDEIDYHWSGDDYNIHFNLT